jgi:hypothetical protein
MKTATSSLGLMRRMEFGTLKNSSRFVMKDLNILVQKLFQNIYIFHNKARSIL